MKRAALFGSAAEEGELINKTGTPRSIARSHSVMEFRLPWQTMKPILSTGGDVHKEMSAQIQELHSLFKH